MLDQRSHFNTVGLKLANGHTQSNPTRAQAIGVTCPGLMLLDAGDYDEDGHSELVFALSLYNRGGCVLFSDVAQDKFVTDARIKVSLRQIRLGAT